MGRLIINSVEIELEPSKPIARTLQVNDIANLSNRQANFTPTFSIPRTAKNIRSFQKLGIVGNNSALPYQRNNAYYYSDSGECLIYNGWAIVTATEKDYRCNVYDGAIDLYKAIENQTLGQLPLTELNHIKNLTNVIASFNGSTTYKYIVADYNGKMLYDTNKINIDYLVPSVPVSYLWDKVFDYYGYTYEGSVFDTFAFQNLYMTFPKGIGSTIPDVAVYESTDLEFINNENSQSKVSNPTLDNKKSTYLKQNSNTTNDLNSIFNNIHFKPVEEGIYRIEVSGEILSKMYFDNGGTLYGTIPLECSLWLAKNSEAITNSDNVTLIQLLQSNLGSDYSFLDTGTIDVNTLVTLQPDESFCLVLRYSGPNVRYLSEVEEITPIELTISKVESSTIDFEGAFIDFKTKDFLNEVLNRFGLTPFKDKFSNNYVFKTLYEIIQDNDVIDWSSKFQSVNSESYVYGTYAQTNNLKYKYNDNESDYNDSSLNIDNVNLEETKDAFKSNIYSPEKLKTSDLFKDTNVYKLWDKEPKDDGSVTYKSLDKRFYFMRVDEFYFTEPKTIGSEILSTETTINSAPYESFFKLSFNDIVQDYYLPIFQILNDAKIINANIYLKEKDIVDLDFSKLYWIEQLGNYFLLNKVSNFQGNGIVKCELIKVAYVPIVTETQTGLQFTITDYTGGCIYYDLNGNDILIADLYLSTDGGATFNFNSSIIDNTGVKCGYSFVSTNIIKFVNKVTGVDLSNEFEIV